MALGTDSTLRLADGRQYGLRRFGETDAPALLLMHGTPGSRLISDFMVQPVLAASLQLITLDRPGFGQSDADYPRRFVRFGSDVGELLDQLALSDVVVAGVSGGGAHALAAAQVLPDRLRAAVVLAGAVPPDAGPPPPGPNRLPLRILRLSPWLFRQFSTLMTGGAIKALASPEKTEKLLARMERKMPAADRERLAQPGAREGLVANLREAFRQGGAATTEESLMMGSPWDFDPGEIAIPVHWWHGREDANVSASAAERLVQLMPDGHWHALEGGHAAWMDHWPAILDRVRGLLAG